MPRIRFYRNTSDERWLFARLPHNLRLLWVGPVFVLVSPRKGR
jgi:hypothetical protein